MIESIRNRAGILRLDIERASCSVDRALIYRWSVCAARWEALRLKIDQGLAAPADDRRYADLTAVLRVISAKLGLETATDDNRAEDSVVGVTVSWGGFLPGDCSHLLGDSWQESAAGW